MADMICIFVRLCMDVSGHIANFEGMMQNKINQLSGQMQGTFEAAKQGYQALREKADGQSKELSKMLSNAGTSYDRLNGEIEMWRE